MIKSLAIAVAVILSLGLTTSIFAQNQTSTTGLQIQLVPEVQRGQQQHVTVFSVDDDGNVVNSSEIITTITNERGNLVGPKTLYTESGEDVSYKVGPNTRPQNISIDSCLSDAEVCAQQFYWVFPKGQAQVPDVPPVIEPEPEVPEVNDTENGEIVVPDNGTDVTTPENGTDVTVNDTGEVEPLPPTPELPTEPTPNGTIPQVPEGNETGSGENQTEIPLPPIVEPPTGDNATGNQTSGNQTTEPVPFPPINDTIPVPETPVANATDAFDVLENSTAVLDQKLDEVLDNGNDTNRGELKAALDETAGAIGGTSGVIVNATSDQLLLLQNTFISGSEAIDEVLSDNAGDEEEEENGE